LLLELLSDGDLPYLENPMNRRELLTAAVGCLPVTKLAKAVPDYTVMRVSEAIEPIVLNCKPLTVKLFNASFFITQDLIDDSVLDVEAIMRDGEQKCAAYNDARKFDPNSTCETCNGSCRVEGDCGCGGDCSVCMEGDTRCPDCDGTGWKAVKA
jgi:hypothetical protein